MFRTQPWQAITRTLQVRQPAVLPAVQKIIILPASPHDVLAYYCTAQQLQQVRQPSVSLLGPRVTQAHHRLQAGPGRGDPTLLHLAVYH